MNALGIVFLAAGAYVLYRQFAPADDPAAAVAANGSTVPAVRHSDTKALVAEAAARGGYGPGALLSAHQWNYYYAQARGLPGPDPGLAWPDLDTFTYQMTLDEWWSGMQSVGLSGLVRRQQQRVRRAS